MPASIASQTTATADSALSLTINVPSGTTDGDLLVLWMHMLAPRPLSGLGDWTEQEAGGTSASQAYLYTRVASSEPASYTITWSPERSLNAVMFRITDHDGVDVTGLNYTGGSTDPVSPTITPSQADTLGLWLMGTRGESSSSTPPSGTVEVLDAQVNISIISAATETLGATATGTRTWSPNGDEYNGHGGVIAIAPATSSVITGTGTHTSVAPTFTGAGSVVVSGTGTLSPALPTFTGTGLLGVYGTGTHTGVAPTFSGSGTVVVPGTGTFTQAAPTFSGTGTVVLTGTGSTTGYAPTFDGTAVINAIGGTGTFIGSAPTFSGAGKVLIKGPGSYSAPGYTVTGTGIVEIVGTGSTEIAAPTFTGTGVAGGTTVSGSGAYTGPVPTFTGAGTVILTGTGTYSAPFPALLGSQSIFVDPWTVPAETRIHRVSAETRIHTVAQVITP